MTAICAFRPKAGVDVDRTFVGTLPQRFELGEIPDRKAIRRRPGKQMVEGNSFRLADEVRYIQRRAADRHGRVVTVGQLVLFSPETGDAWLLDPSDQLATRLAGDCDPEPSPHRRKRYLRHRRLEGQLSHRGTRLHLFRSPDPARLGPSSDTPRPCSRHRPEISNIFG